jgi:hypothetical protein
MTLAAAETVIDAVAMYALVGAVFAVPFLWRWVGRLDPLARHATWGFRVLVFPGVMLFWPVFAWHLARGSSGPPEEWTAHRARARRIPIRHERGRGVEVLR